MTLTPRVPKPAWLDRFANRVGALRPETSPLDAYAYAETTFPEAADLAPEEAAEIFAPNLPPVLEGAADE